MEKAALLDTLTELLREVLDRDDFTLEPGTTAADVDGWGSLEFIRFILAVERHFGTKFGTAEVAALRSVGDFVDLILRHR